MRNPNFARAQNAGSDPDCYLLFSFMLTEKVKDVAKTTQIITQTIIIYENIQILDTNGSG